MVLDYETEIEMLLFDMDKIVKRALLISIFVIIFVIK